MISFSDVTKNYGDTRVLGPVTATIPEGGITSLIGPNGAGKSTLLTIMGRLIEADAGSLSIGGLDVRRAKSAELARKVAILRQENHLSARLTVRDLVALGRFPHSRGRLTAECVAAVESALEFLNLTALQDRFLDQLSGGQRQRAFVAMVLAQDTDYILLDEPLNNLDMKHSVLMMKQLRRAADELGKTVVLVIHDVNFAAAYSDRIVALRDGLLVHEGTVEETMTAEVLTGVFDTPVTVHTIGCYPTAVYTH
ncbi:iron ABC transporter ATP-binding protein [Arthrobacter woluwensis]|uniref:Iron complex transport system ATP-binding protein n=1 Tax=Arthrobacter woluwensis TaxID=156980 RepID=A0A1H4JLU1_9MICC|nr:ATP-binding cassette domain-containing protein [Arthrobacter woluwensis]SEB46925.1 iron complex transport system ATP-binding protein [Arthrobacter woluwensis]